jgi:hypothetical protein
MCFQGFHGDWPTPLSGRTSDMLEEGRAIPCCLPPHLKGCKLCHSNLQAESLSKIAIHPVERLDDPAKPMVWVFPKLSFCINCGRAEIRFSESRGITFQ